MEEARQSSDEEITTVETFHYVPPTEDHTRRREIQEEEMREVRTPPQTERPGVNVDSERPPLSCCEGFLMFLSVILLFLFFPIALCASIKVIQEYERAVILRLGRMLSGGLKGPGLFVINPITDDMTIVDMRTKTFDIPPQEVLTKDSVTVYIDAIVYYHVFDPMLTVLAVKDSDRATQLLAQTTLRNVIGTYTLGDLLTEREAIADSIQEMIDAPTDDWGIKIERVEMRDVRLPHSLQRAMAAEAEANRDARAKIIAAEGERNASRALKEASEVMKETPSAVELRYLQTLQSISDQNNSTVVFPLPMELVRHFSKK